MKKNKIQNKFASDNNKKGGFISLTEKAVLISSELAKALDLSSKQKATKFVTIYSPEDKSCFAIHFSDKSTEPMREIKIKCENKSGLRINSMVLSNWIKDTLGFLDERLVRYICPAYCSGSTMYFKTNPKNKVQAVLSNMQSVDIYQWHNQKEEIQAQKQRRRGYYVTEKPHLTIYNNFSEFSKAAMTLMGGRHRFFYKMENGPQKNILIEVTDNDDDINAYKISDKRNARASTKSTKEIAKYIGVDLKILRSAKIPLIKLDRNTFRLVIENMELSTNDNPVQKNPEEENIEVKEEKVFETQKVAKTEVVSQQSSENAKEEKAKGPSLEYDVTVTLEAHHNTEGNICDCKAHVIIQGAQIHFETEFDAGDTGIETIRAALKDMLRQIM